MPGRPLRIATFLAPNLLSVYALVARAMERALGLPVELVVGSSYEQLHEEIDVAFVCGLAYVELEREGKAPVEPIAAPVLHGERYGGRPVYFSDVIVRRDAPFQSFADLRGCSWSINEPLSQSGYGITRYCLMRLGETVGYFGRVVESGFHERSIRLVCAGEVDASAVDSQVLAVALHERPELVELLRVVESFGPSTIQPVVAARRLSRSLREDMRAVLLRLGEDAEGRKVLDRGFVQRFVPIEDHHYDDLREMRDACAAAGFLELR